MAMMIRVVMIVCIFEGKDVRRMRGKLDTDKNNNEIKREGLETKKNGENITYKLNLYIKLKRLRVIRVPMNPRAPTRFTRILRVRAGHTRLYFFNSNFRPVPARYVRVPAYPRVRVKFCHL
jgi:hypothetical protein